VFWCGREVVGLGEKPVVGQAECDVVGEHLKQRVWNVDGALGVVLRQPNLDVAVEALDLAPHVHLAAQAGWPLLAAGSASLTDTEATPADTHGTARR